VCETETTVSQSPIILFPKMSRPQTNNRPPPAPETKSSRTPPPPPPPPPLKGGKVETNATQQQDSISKLFRPNEKRRKSLANEGGATIELAQKKNNIFTTEQKASTPNLTELSIHEVAIDILPESETKKNSATGATGDILGRKRSSSSLSRKFSFKSNTSKTSITSSHLFHSERDEIKLIAKTLECIVPNPHILKLQDDQTFSLESRTRMLEKKEAKQFQLLENKTLLSEARSIETRMTPGGNDHVDRAGGFSPYLWTDDQENHRQNSLRNFVPYIPGYLLRPKLRSPNNFESHEKVDSIEQLCSPKDDTVFNIKTFCQLSNFPQGLKLGPIVSKFIHLEVVILKNAGISDLNGWCLPKLLYCDLSGNNISSIVPLVVLAEHSFHLQVLEIRSNPLTSSSTWPPNSQHPGHDVRGVCHREWQLLIEFPDLVLLNGKPITLEHHEHVCSELGGSDNTRIARINLRRWDQMVSEAAPELVSGISANGKKKIWKPLAVTHLAVPNVGLVEFHVGCFRSLLTLDLSKNRIAHLEGSGLEACEYLWALNLSHNKIFDIDELQIFSRMPSLRCLFLQDNPLPEGYEDVVVAITMHLPGSDHSAGLLELNGIGITIDDRIKAAFHPKNGKKTTVTENGGRGTSSGAKSWCCCFKSYNNSNSLSTDIDIMKGPDGTIQVPEVDQLRFNLEIDNFYGRGYLSSIPSFGSLVFLRLEGRNLKIINLKPFSGLETLDLQNNPIKLLIGLETLTNLHVLDLRGHPTSGSDERITKWLQISEKLYNLHSISLLSRPIEHDSEEGKTFHLRVLRTLHLKSHKYLGMIESQVVSIELRARLMKEERGSDTHPTDLEMGRYKAQLAVLTCTHHAVGRSYAYEDVVSAAQVDTSNVVELERMHGLGLHDAVLNFAPFTKLRVLNLSGNEIENILKLGLDDIKTLRVLDLSFNRITNKLKVIGEYINRFKNLVVLCLRGNPGMHGTETKKRRSSIVGAHKDEESMYSKQRLSLIGAISDLRKVDCHLEIIDTQITVDERIEAWKSYGGANDQLEKMRTKMAMFLAVPTSMQPKLVLSIDLDGQMLRNVDVSEYVNLNILRLRGNLLKNITDISGLNNLKILKALDMRDNMIPLDKKSITKMCKLFNAMKYLTYLGLFTTNTVDESIKKRRQSLSIAAKSRKRRSSIKNTDSNGMTDALALAVGSVVLSNTENSATGPETPAVIGDEQDEDETAEQHINARPGSTYRKNLLKGLLPTLKHSNCYLRFLDWNEIHVDEIFTIWGNGIKKGKARHKFRFEVISRRETRKHTLSSVLPKNSSVLEEDPTSIKSLDFSGYKLSTVEVTPYRNILSLSLANNNINDSALQSSGIKSLKLLTLLDISKNKLTSLKTMAKVIDRLPRIEKIYCLGNTAYSRETTDKLEYRLKMLGALARTGWSDFSIKSFNGNSFTFNERIKALSESHRTEEAEMMILAKQFLKAKQNVWCTHLKIQCKLQGGICVLGLKAAARPVMNNSTPPHQFSQSELFRLRTFRYFPNGAFSKVRVLDLRNNCLLSLKNSYLHLLPELSSLDLRDNRLTSIDSITRELQKCPKLESICLLWAGKEKKLFGNEKFYGDQVFKRLRGLLHVDNLKRPKKYDLTSLQQSAADFLYTVAGVPKNSIEDIDMRNCLLESQHFSSVLAALNALQELVITLHMSGNPWEDSGVGPSDDNYRKYVVAKMGDTLIELDNIPITEDERGTAGEWYEKQKEDFGKAAEEMDNKWGHLKEQAGTIGFAIAEYKASEYNKQKQLQLDTRGKLPSDITNLYTNTSSTTEEGFKQLSKSVGEVKDSTPSGSDIASDLAEGLVKMATSESKTSSGSSGTSNGESDAVVDNDEDIDFDVDVDDMREDFERGEGGIDSRRSSFSNFDGDDDDFNSDDEDDEVRQSAKNNLSEEISESLATGEMSTKFEILINFFQIYGLILNFDISIPWPKLWIDFQVIYGWIPSLTIFDFTYIFKALKVDVSTDESEYLLFFSVVIFAFTCFISYHYFHSLEKKAFLKKIEKWNKERCKFFTIWFVLMLLTFIITAFMDIPTSTSSFGHLFTSGTFLQWSDGMYAIFLILMIVFNVMILIWVGSVCFLRSRFHKDDTPQKSKFSTLWAKLKRFLQKACLFALSVFYIPVSKTILSTYGSEYNVDVCLGICPPSGCKINKNSTNSSAMGSIKENAAPESWGRDTPWLTSTNITELPFGNSTLWSTGGEYPCCLKIFKYETCAAFQSEKALPLQIMALFFLIIITIGLPIFFVVLIKNGVAEINRGGYLMKKNKLDRTIKKNKEKIKNIKKGQSTDIQKKIGLGQEVDVLYKKYAEMGKHDAKAEIRAIEKSITEDEGKLKNLYSKEVLDNPKAQTYLYLPYDYNHRYYKVTTLMQKLMLLIIQLFVPPQIIANLKMILGSIFVVIGAFLASLEQPFSDSMESLMEMSSQITNAVNILVGLGITSGMPWLQEWYGDAILFTVNGINVAVFLMTLVVSPLRNCLFAAQFTKMQAQLQREKMEEYTKKQAFLAAQKGAGAFDAIRRSSVVRAANGIAAEAGASAFEGVTEVRGAIPGTLSEMKNAGDLMLHNVRDSRNAALNVVRGGAEVGSKMAQEGLKSASEHATIGANIAASNAVNIVTGAQKLYDVELKQSVNQAVNQAINVAQNAASTSLDGSKSAINLAVVGTEHLENHISASKVSHHGENMLSSASSAASKLSSNVDLTPRVSESKIQHINNLATIGASSAMSGASSTVASIANTDLSGIASDVGNAASNISNKVGDGINEMSNQQLMGAAAAIAVGGAVAALEPDEEWSSSENDSMEDEGGDDGSNGSYYDDSD
jgi:Leucine-rich repeat (LRR) protein